MPGIEPGAFHMQSERSTAELHPHLQQKSRKTNTNLTSTVVVVGKFDIPRSHNMREPQPNSG